MLSKILTITLLVCALFIGQTKTSLAETCYTATGSVDTVNLTPTTQFGTIDLTLTDSGGKTRFNESGFLIGNITGTDESGSSYLSHRALFPRKTGFVTQGDKADPVPPFVRKTLDDGTPCSYWIHETISQLAKGRKIFSKVTSVEIYADGYISSCPDENQNWFELSGQMCVE